MKRSDRSIPETSGKLVPPPRKPPTAIGTATLPNSPNLPPYRPGTYPDGPSRIQRAALALLGPSCAVVAGGLLASGIAGAFDLGIVLLAAGAGFSWRAAQVQQQHRVLRRSMKARSRAA